MALSWAGADARIHRLRLVGVHGDPLQARLRLERLLGAVDLQPPGLPPSAILCIHQLADPLPGTLSLDRPAARPPPAWEQALRASLERLARGAARPIRGPVPAAAEAVLFLDGAELLACLARDCADGSAGARWWWPGLLRGRDPFRSLVPAWQEAPECVPAALQHLASWGHAGPFAARLREEEARELLREVVRCFAVAPLEEALAAPAAAEAAPPELTPFGPDATGPDTGAEEPPWRAWVPEASQGPRTARQLLLGIGLLLHRAPMLARAPSLPEAVLRWRRAPGRAAAAARDAARGREPPSLATEAAGPAAPAAPPASAAPRGAARLRVRPVVPPGPATQGSPAHGPLPSDRPPAAPEVDPPAPPPSAPSSAVARRSAAPAPREAAAPPAQCQTELGGLFFLLNLALYLGLYGDFTAPARPGIALSPWDLVALLGGRLLDDPHRDDPVWALLAALAGRAAETAPGDTFTPPDSLRVPDDWLAPFPAVDTLRLHAAGGRLRVAHPAGFLLLDLPLREGDAAPIAEAELRAYPRLAGARLVPAEAPGPVAPPGLERWLAWLLGYVQARLGRALGLSSPEELAPVLLRHRARILVTATHVQVAMSLAGLPIQVRLAGLDRDPGWIPAAGRQVLFHFE